MDLKKKLDQYRLSKKLIDKCRKNGFRLTIAESCTGGLISSAITAVPGSSDIFESSFVTYSNKAKINFLGVSLKTLNLFGAVSEQVVIEMIKGLKEKTNSDIFLAISGIAGPGGFSEEKPEGLVWVSYSLKSNDIKTIKLSFGAIGRELVREKSTTQSLKLLLSLFKN